MEQTSTATWRKRARDAEARQQWLVSALCWHAALWSYPSTTGALALADRERMADRYDAVAGRAWSGSHACYRSTHHFVSLDPVHGGTVAYPRVLSRWWREAVEA